MPRRLRKLERQAGEAREKILDLNKQRDREQENLHAMRTMLALELRTAYMAGRQERIKLLLNQEDPAFLGRMLVYHGYFTRARAARMQDMRTTLARLDDIEHGAPPAADGNRPPADCATGKFFPAGCRAGEAA